jgi:hypothetical protein
MLTDCPIGLCFRLRCGGRAGEFDDFVGYGTVGLGADNCVIATTNVGHLSRYCSADLWQNI